MQNYITHLSYLSFEIGANLKLKINLNLKFNFSLLAATIRFISLHLF